MFLDNNICKTIDQPEQQLQCINAEHVPELDGLKMLKWYLSKI